MTVLKNKILLHALMVFYLSFGLIVQTYSQGGKNIEKENLEESIKNFLSNYSEFGQLSPDGNSISNSYKNSFQDLFIKDATVFNDINGNKNAPKHIQIAEYIEYIVKTYTRGLKIKIHSFQVSKPYKGENNLLNVIVDIDKEVFGLYKGDKVYRNRYDLRFLIQFENINNNPTRLKILSVKRTNISKNTITIEVSPMYTQFIMEEPKLYGQYTAWSNNGELGYGLNIKYQYSINPFLGVGTGFGFSTYNSTFSMSYVKQDDYSTTDRDLDDYYLRFEAENLQEKISYQYINVPLFVRINPLFTSRINFIFLEAGIQFLFPISTNSEFSGLTTYTGYYPQYHVLLYDIPELDFYTNRNVNTANSITAKSVTLNGYAMLGAKIPFANPAYTLNIGFIYTRSFTPISENNVERIYLSTAYGEYSSFTESSSKVHLQSFGISIGLSIGLD